jgi:aryl-alcohol dehydrogenase-like predicted oxidoreductase
VKKGRIRHLGISISSKRGAYQAENAARVGASVLQVVYNRIERKPEDDGTFEAVTEHDLGVLARVPLASGFLSGKYSADSTFDTNDVREVWGGDKRQQVLEEVEKVKGEVPNGVPMAQWALAWCLKHEAVTCVIPGCRNVEQVISNAAAAEME